MKLTIETNGESFSIEVESDPESGWLIGEVIELPGCYTQAPDMAALEIAMREAIGVYLETLQTDV